MAIEFGDMVRVIVGSSEKKGTVGLVFRVFTSHTYEVAFRDGESYEYGAQDLERINRTMLAHPYITTEQIETILNAASKYAEVGDPESMGKKAERYWKFYLESIAQQINALLIVVPTVQMNEASPTAWTPKEGDVIRCN